MNKHAYLIIVHSNFEQFKKLLRLIDDPRNDIYIHIDAKIKDIDINAFTNCCKESNVFLTPRIEVTWGGYSQIQVELILLKTALNKGVPYSYFHLLSGRDLPLKTQDYIHQFFEENNGKEFVQFQKRKISIEKKKRVQYYYLLQEFIGKDHYFISKFQGLTLRMQQILGINRVKNENFEFQMGSNWFSITNKLASYIVSQTEKIKSYFKYTLCCDELFLQSVIINSSFKNNLYDKSFSDSQDGNKRLIFWQNHSPRIITMADLDTLRNSKQLFARKFDSNVDSKVIKVLYKNLMSEQKKPSLLR